MTCRLLPNHRLILSMRPHYPPTAPYTSRAADLVLAAQPGAALATPAQARYGDVHERRSLAPATV
jgi:hypothetical protein